MAFASTQNANQYQGSPSKAIYRLLCAQEQSIPIFARDWWLDATAGENNWDVVLVERSDEVVASLPFVVRRRFGLTTLTQPPLTQTLGPWIRPMPSASGKSLALTKDWMNALIEQLPPHDKYEQNWHHTQRNWLPFFWRGYRQSTRYTYRFPNLTNHDVLWSGLGSNIKTDIKKAKNRYNLRLSQSAVLVDFIRLNEQTFARQGLQVPYQSELIERIHIACATRKSGRFFIIEDPHGVPHAGAYVIWDENSAYYLMGGGDPLLRSSGATSLCLWEAIKFSSTVTKSFDFEGSMIEPVERFFRAFGAKQTEYYSIHKINSFLLRAGKAIFTFRHG